MDFLTFLSMVNAVSQEALGTAVCGLSTFATEVHAKTLNLALAAFINRDFLEIESCQVKTLYRKVVTQRFLDDFFSVQSSEVSLGLFGFLKHMY